MPVRKWLLSAALVAMMMSQTLWKVATKAPGRVETILVDEGDFVVAGRSPRAASDRPKLGCAKPVRSRRFQDRESKIVEISEFGGCGPPDKLATHFVITDRRDGDANRGRQQGEQPSAATIGERVAFSHAKQPERTGIKQDDSRHG